MPAKFIRPRNSQLVETSKAKSENFHSEFYFANDVQFSLAQKGNIQSFLLNHKTNYRFATCEYRQINHIGNNNCRLATDPKSNTHMHIAQTTNATKHMSRSRMLCMYNEIWVSAGHRACNAINTDKRNVGNNSIFVIKIFSIYLCHVVGAASATSIYSHFSANWASNRITEISVHHQRTVQTLFSVSFVIECQEVESDVRHVQHHIHHFASNVCNVHRTFMIWISQDIIYCDSDVGRVVFDYYATNDRHNHNTTQTHDRTNGII